LLPARKSAFLAEFVPDGYGKALTTAFRLAQSQPDARFQKFPGCSSAEIWPGNPISCLEALLPNIEYDFVL
jgi:hypothetical protein